MKLSTEDKEDLQDLMQHAGYKPLVRAMEHLVRDQQDAVLKCLSDDERNLVRLKCRSEGAAKLLGDLQRYLDNLRAPQKAKARQHE